MNASTAYTACGILTGITIASPALHWYFTPPTVNSPTPSRTVTMASPVESCVPICPMFLLIFMNKKSVEELSIHGDGGYLPWDEFATVLEGFFGCHFQTTAAWNFHADNGYAGDIVVSDDLFKFFTVVCGIQLRTAYQDDPAFDKIFVAHTQTSPQVVHY